MVNLEETFYTILLELTRQTNMSASAYARALIVRDLVERGLVPQRTLMHVIGGTLPPTLPARVEWDFEKVADGKSKNNGDTCT